jgi:hypothetical protein
MLSIGRENWSMVMLSKSDTLASDEFPGKISLGITNVTLLPATGGCYCLHYRINRNFSGGDNQKWIMQAPQF